MPVFKVIYRIDFGKPNFDIIDRPGLVMQLLSEMGDKYWDVLQENSAARSIVASTKNTEKLIHRQMAVEPTQINFSMEDAKGIDIARLENNDTFTCLMKGINTLCEAFGIKELQRSGLRFFYFASFSKDNADLKPAFEKLIGKDILSAISSSIGNTIDYGLSIDGGDKDKLKYHLRFGPYLPEEAQRYFDHFHENIQEEQELNFACDLDMYEETFSLSIRPYTWSKALIQKADKLVKNLEKSLTSK